MAFSADELRVLRRALAVALHPSKAASVADVQDCLDLSDGINEAIDEGARLCAFLVADLGRYRAALPGTAAGYLQLLADALAAGHRPEVDDLAALRALRGNPLAAALLDRCRALAEHDVRNRPAATPRVPASRTRLLALPGGRAEGDKPAPDPKKPAPQRTGPDRPVPTPAEVFPPKRRPAAPAGPAETDEPAAPSQKLAAG
ncbi:hypothetical protein QIS99_22305 [Streptomyces sp. B-S-A8]|uniref:Uncharacterized protein n=1 Tax=Streptomyces solicavernae TaxID=3043614 RepID=A0ABT6RX51_9ACTN|nr:hypothetical protein [Streptomyces sp. B-S-A8]MDI3388905.1 hypothetical protein [Streptomyces sp. B-S-A8]